MRLLEEMLTREDVVVCRVVALSRWWKYSTDADENVLLRLQPTGRHFQLQSWRMNVCWFVVLDEINQCHPKNSCMLASDI